LRQKAATAAPVGVSFRQHIYAQVIDDAQGRTVAAASSLDTGLREAISPAN